MRKMKKLLAVALSAVMVLGMGATALADELSEGTKGGDKTITITPPSDAADNQEFTYTVYKVFDAATNGEGISYKLLKDAETAPNGFRVDDGGNVYLGTVQDTKPTEGDYYEVKINKATKYIIPQTAELTSDQIAAIAAYENKKEVGTVKIKGKDAKTVTVPDYGYYYVTTTTGSVVSINSTKKNAEIKDKNVLPKVDKKVKSISDGTVATGEQAGESGTGTIGKEVTYEVKVTAQPGAVNYIFHDQLSKGLTLKTGSLKVAPATFTNDSTTKATYTQTKFANETEDGKDDITLTFDNDYLKTITVATPITITYTATINKDAVIGGDGNGNSATLDYGHKSNTDSKPSNTTPSDGAVVYVYSFDLVKTTSDGTLLPGAEFKLWADADKTKPIKLTEVTANSVYRVADATESTDATIKTKNSKITINGLANGTYYLEETKAPDGYNMLTELKSITITDRNLEATISGNKYEEGNGGVQIVNQSGTLLPSTGGMGTTIFYIIGGILVVGAGVVLIAKRRIAMR